MSTSTSTGTIFSQLLLLLLVVPPSTATATTHGRAACLPRERDALLAFKRAITSDPAGQLASWRPGAGGHEDCCRWRDVRCSNRTGHVLQLRLRHTHSGDCVGISCAMPAMAGQISPSLLSLQHLAHLDLSVQLLQGRTGRVPEFLGSLSNLRCLDLSCLPPQLGNLSKLRHLDLSQNEDANLSEQL
ncbi:receptor-like protein EIX2 [Triticum dicoccoides]|uniref:receptor-like protein EIX2 n=1 Tax=Triticum dicoccoides TaxID=85692 RepID=UPI00188F16BB|nr:receptor-like protein EIX2 [Triticum dicoccoides]